ncbi:MAG: methyltransferase RsmF C-terminal domain-like protein [Crocinitomicaceae bacterium]
MLNKGLDMSDDKRFKSGFFERIEKQINDADKLREILDGEPLTSIRINPKYEVKIEGEQVPWNPQGRYLAERPSYNKDPLYHSGAYYPMEASSMFLDYALRQIEISDSKAILDLCAAPGGKSLILRDHYKENLLVSNEIDGKRVHVLKENSIKWGALDHLVVQSDASRLLNSDLRYGLVVVDAPCSGEGLFRKDLKSRAEWTEERAAGCAVRQNDILDDAVNLILPEGYLIYSTCTYNPAENMDQIDRIMKSGQFEPVELELDHSFGVIEVKTDLAVGYQFWPHRIKGEGFFLAVLKKNASESNPIQLKLPKGKPVTVDSLLKLPNDRVVLDLDGRYYLFSETELNAIEQLKRCTKIIKKGVYLGEIKGKDFLPSYDVSHQSDIIGNYPKIELDSESAIKYLQGNALFVEAPKGPVLLTFQNIVMGTGKSNGQRINNLYPKHLRII